MFFIVSRSPLRGAADNLTMAFKKNNINVTLLVFNTKNFRYPRREEVPVKIINKKNYRFWFRALKKSKSVLIISVDTLSNLEEISSQKEYRNLLRDINPAIFLTGTSYRVHSAGYNSYFYKFGIFPIFAMPDLVRLGNKNISFFQPMEYSEIKISKPKSKIIVAHSPGKSKRRYQKKGTYKIRKAVGLLNNQVIYDEFSGVPLLKCLQRKADSHIFIDQLSPRVGGLGKNGLEGIVMNCVTLCSVNKSHFGHYSDIPVKSITNIITTKTQILKVSKNIDEEIEKSKNWKSKINFNNSVDYILEKWKSVCNNNSPDI